MVGTSFRSCSPRVYPWRGGQKLFIPVVAAVLVALGGGGGGGKKSVETPTGQTVRGNGFRFLAPLGWIVTREPTSVTVAPKAKGSTLVKVYAFRTVKRYDPRLWPEAA